MRGTQNPLLKHRAFPCAWKWQMPTVNSYPVTCCTAPSTLPTSAVRQEQPRKALLAQMHLKLECWDSVRPNASQQGREVWDTSEHLALFPSSSAARNMPQAEGEATAKACAWKWHWLRVMAGKGCISVPHELCQEQSFWILLLDSWRKAD